MSPSVSNCTSFPLSGPKPRFFASRSATAKAWRLGAKDAYRRMLMGPCSLPSLPFRSVYITTIVAILAFFDLSPFFRRGFLPYRPRWSRPR